MPPFNVEPARLTLVLREDSKGRLLLLWCSSLRFQPLMPKRAGEHRHGSSPSPSGQRRCDSPHRADSPAARSSPERPVSRRRPLMTMEPPQLTVTAGNALLYRPRESPRGQKSKDGAPGQEEGATAARNGSPPTAARGPPSHTGLVIDLPRPGHQLVSPTKAPPSAGEMETSRSAGRRRGAVAGPSAAFAAMAPTATVYGVPGTAEQAEQAALEKGRERRRRGLRVEEDHRSSRLERHQMLAKSELGVEAARLAAAPLGAEAARLAAAQGRDATGALAAAAQGRGVPCTIVVPRDTPGVKVRNIARYGAKVVLCEPTQQARLEPNPSPRPNPHPNP